MSKRDLGGSVDAAAVPEPNSIKSWREFKEIVREDWSVNNRSWRRPGLQAMAMYRLGVWQRSIRNPLLRATMRKTYTLLHQFIRNFYGIELPHSTIIGRRLWIAHQSGIVIHPEAVIGDDCLIRQGVTIGRASNVGGGVNSRAPRLGNRVKVGAGAVIMGGITIGDDVVIGPNAVVMTNIPDGSIVAAPQARVFAPPPKPKPHTSDRSEATTENV